MNGVDDPLYDYEDDPVEWPEVDEFGELLNPCDVDDPPDVAAWWPETVDA